MFFIKNSLRYIEKQINPYQNSKVEIQCITLTLKNSDMDIMNIYIPPNTRLREAEILHYTNQLHHQFIICGDMNGRHRLWEPSSTRRNNRIGNVLARSLSNNDNIALATPPDLGTHMNEYSGNTSTIDLCLVSAPLLTHISVNTLADMRSDHLPVLVTVRTKPDRIARGKRSKWSIKEKMWPTWQENVSNLPPTAPGTLEEEYNTLMAGIHRVSTEVFRKTSNSVKQKLTNPAWNENCSRYSALLKRARRRMEKRKTRENKREYRRLLAATLRVHLETEREFWRKYSSKITPSTPAKEIWDMVMKLKGTYRPPNIPLFSGGDVHFTKQQKATVFAEHFQQSMTSDQHRVYPQEVTETIENAKTGGQFPTSDTRFTMHELQNALKKLEKNKAYGTDEISNNILLHLPHTKHQELLGMFNRSWREGILPTSWKTGMVIPIAKPGKNPRQPESYRPIALLQCTGKLMETMVGERLKFIAETENLLSNTQYGFRFRRSTIDPILELEHEIRTGLAKHEVTVVVFFDLKAAYDTVDHTHLLHTLAQCGIGGKMLTWLEDFLRNRKICTIIEDYISEMLEINQGVPQGSGLSTILFILLLSTLPGVWPVRSKEFADDVSYSYTTKILDDAETYLQDAIDRFAEWASNKGLRINAAKTKVMYFTRQRVGAPRLTLEGEEIEVVPTFRYLGFILDAPNLTWSAHIENLKSECNRGLNLMKALANTKFRADRDSLLNIYGALIKGKISYSCPLLISASDSNINKLEVIQNSALRIATGALKSSQIHSLQCEAHVPPLRLYIIQQSLKTYYKLVAKGRHHPVYEYIFGYDYEDITWSTAFKKPFALLANDLIRTWETPHNLILPAMEYPCLPPWDPLETLIHKDLLTPVTKSVGNSILKSEALSTISTLYQNHLHIYTDGSKYTDDQHKPVSTTAAFYVPEIDIRGHWRLDKNVSIVGAELSAIQKATNWIFIQPQVDPRPTVILSDSQVSLQLLLQRKPVSYVYSVTKVQQNILELRRRGWNISIQWVPSHCGIQGNEMADTLANEAHALDIIDDYPSELADIQPLINRAYNAQWARLWDEKKNSCPLGRIKHKTIPWPHSRHRNRPLDVILTRFRLGHTKLNAHMAAKGLRDSATCSQCDAQEDETIQHFLLNCERYREPRKKMRDNLLELGVTQMTIPVLLGASDFDLTTKTRITEEVGIYLQKTHRIKEL